MKLEKIYYAFPEDADCLQFLEKIRWDDKPRCPYCGSRHCTSVPREGRHHCNNCNTTFSVTVGTLFQKTKIDLRKWFLAFALMEEKGKKVTVRGMADQLRVNKNTAWSILKRVRQGKAEDPEFWSRLMGEMEAAINSRRNGFGKPAGKEPGRT